MSFQVSTARRTRLVRPAHRAWNESALAYMRRAVEFLVEHYVSALFLDPGLGKTAITLESFRRLRAMGEAERMLVVAPLRVCQLVWRQEGAKWSEFRDLTFSLVHGPKKAERLRDDADIHVINPEGIPWLINQFYRSELPWDTVVLDELTRFKNHQSQRAKLLRKKLQGKRRWGLTGSPAPNGYMDLFGQMLMLDDGAALGRYITQYRDSYFVAGYNGFDWGLRGGAAKQIEERIAPYVLRMAAEDYLTLPQVVDNVIPVRLPPEAMKKYTELKDEFLLTLPEGVITAANSGAVYSKLKQLANGAVYLAAEDGERAQEYVEIHSAKLDALEELIESLNGQQLLVAYEFRHDLERIRARLGKDTPALAGVSGARAAEIEGAWNRGEIPVLLVHPASAGHGLNLQGSSAAHICWFSKPWDLELYEQLIGRLKRQGSEAARVMNHALLVPGSLDEVVDAGLRDKDTTQRTLLSALNADILRDEPATHTEENEMSETKKLGFRRPGAEAPAQAATRPQPRGWGGAAATGIADDDEMPPLSAFEDSQSDEDSASPTYQIPKRSPAAAPRGWGSVTKNTSEADMQREAISQKLQAPPLAEIVDEEEEIPASERALSLFPAGIVNQLSGEGAEDAAAEAPADAPAAEAPARRPRTRSRKAAAEQTPVTLEAPEPSAPKAPPTVATEETVTLTATAPASQAPVAAAQVERKRSPQWDDQIGAGRILIEFSGVPGHALADVLEALATQVRGTD